METLHENLARYAYDGMVRHPLVITALTKDASHINAIYEQQRTARSKARANGDWEEYVFLHTRPYRLDALVAATKYGLKEKPSEFWELLGRVWIDTENAHQHPKKWRQLWTETTEGRRACMSDEDLRIFDSLPEQIEVWRGTSHKRGHAGLSWTRDREMAVFFARRLCYGSRVPLLAKGIVNKIDVLAYFGERDEQEIVSMKVSVISVTESKDVLSDAARNFSISIGELCAKDSNCKN
jgi:hypothetical protein